ncbi:MAG: prepilin-type N-terminal cleavage/methylation domain-containing protein [Planctomycetota bacterium]
MAAPPARRRAAAFRGGFNLIEVMVSMGIFVIAFVAVASIFPTAITLQREATQTVDDRAAEASAEAIASAMKLSHGTNIDPDPAGDSPVIILTVGALYSSGQDEPYRIQPLLDDLDGNPPDLELPARTFGSNPNNSEAPEDRRYIWVPFIRPLNDSTSILATEWELTIALLRRSEFDADVVYSNGKTFSAGWASDGKWSSPSTGGEDSEDTYPGMLRVQLTNPPSYNSNTNVGTFDLPNNDSNGNRLLVAGDIFMDSNGVQYPVLDSTTTSVDVFGEIQPDPDVGDPDALWLAPRPFASGSTTTRPEDAPSPLIAIFDASSAIQP